MTAELRARLAAIAYGIVMVSAFFSSLGLIFGLFTIPATWAEIAWITAISGSTLLSTAYLIDYIAERPSCPHCARRVLPTHPFCPHSGNLQLAPVEDGRLEQSIDGRQFARFAEQEVSDD